MILSFMQRGEDCVSIIGMCPATSNKKEALKKFPYHGASQLMMITLTYKIIFSNIIQMQATHLTLF